MSMNCIKVVPAVALLFLALLLTDPAAGFSCWAGVALLGPMGVEVLSVGPGGTSLASANMLSVNTTSYLLGCSNMPFS